MASRLVEHEVERIAVEGTACLGEDLLDVGDEHVGVDSFRVVGFPVVGGVDDGRKHFLAADTRNHVEPPRVRARVLHHHILFLSWRHKRACWCSAEPHVSLIEEEHIPFASSLDLLAQICDVITQLPRHYDSSIQRATGKWPDPEGMELQKPDAVVCMLLLRSHSVFLMVLFEVITAFSFPYRRTVLSDARLPVLSCRD